MQLLRRDKDLCSEKFESAKVTAFLASFFIRFSSEISTLMHYLIHLDPLDLQVNNYDCE